jgi:hypothetical protein
MPQRASVFCNFYIRVDREALVSERALDVGSVAFKAMSTKKYFYNIKNKIANSLKKCKVCRIMYDLKIFGQYIF